MSIIYSYPIDAAPQVGDLLLGSSSLDGNPTKTFTIGSIAGLVDTAGGTGTVTQVATSNSTFISLQGGPINGAGVLTASLSALDTPSNTTFLRGDNKWAAATTSGSPNVSILSEGLTLTSAVTSINFTGDGVVVTEPVANSNDILVTIEGSTSAVTSVSGPASGLGIAVSQTTGEVVVSNIGVTNITPGNNITLSAQTGNVVINATQNPGTVQSIIPGNGLKLDSGSLISNPTIGLDYTGSNNYILIGASTDVPVSTDFIAFNKLSNNNVKTTTFSTIPETALPLVQTYIDAGDSNTVSNLEPAGYEDTARINTVVTLTQAQYDSLVAASTTNANTLYVIAASSTTGVVTLNSIDITGLTGPAAGYTVAGNSVNDTFTGVVGEAFSFEATYTANAGYYFSTPVSGNIVNGNLVAGAQNTSLTPIGVIAISPTAPIVSTLLVVTNIQGGPASAWRVTPGGDVTGSTQGATYDFNNTSIEITNNAYTFPTAPTIVKAQGTITGSQTVVTTVTGTLQLT